MAITLKLDDAQLQAIVNEGASLSQEVRALSENLAKWQAEQVAATKEGFATLAGILSGSDEEKLQQMINTLATNLNISADDILTALNQPRQKENNNGS